MRMVTNVRHYLHIFNWFILRHMRSHMGRTLAVLIGIALGAAVFSSVRLAVHATLDSFSQSMQRIAGDSDVTVVQPGGRVPETLVAKLLHHPAVRHASAVMSAYVRPAGQSEPFLLIGIDPILDRRLRTWSVDAENNGANWGAMIATPNALIIGEPLGDLFGWQTGQEIQLSHPHQTDDFTVLATLQSNGLALVEGGRVALCDIATFQEFTGIMGRVDRIDVQLNSDGSNELMAALTALLPDGVVIRSPSEQHDSGQGMIRAYQLSLTFLSFISLFVGMFLVYSLVALNAAARRRELAVMRATGASRRLIFFLFISEGGFIGLSGWLLAWPISTMLVKYLLAGVSQTVSMLFVRVQVDSLVLSPWELMVSFVSTVTVAALAALPPARDAMRVPPREAMEIAPMAALRPRLMRTMALMGMGLLVLVYPISRLPSPPSVSLPGYLAALFLFIGFALLTPLLLRWIGRMMAPRLAPIGGQPAYLAAGYLRESGVQTAISVGALVTAVALFTALVVMVHSFRSTVALWVTQSIAGDLYIRPKLSELNRFRDPLPPRVVAAVIALPVPVDLVPMRRLELRVNGHQHLFEAMDYAAYARHSRFIWMTGNPRQIEAELVAGNGVAVSEVFANNTGLGPGDRYRTLLNGRVLDEPILGVFRDYRTRGGVVYYSLSRYRDRFDDSGWSGVQVNFSNRGPELSRTVSQVRAELLNCCGESIEMIEGGKLREAILQIFDETFAITTVLLLIALVVAALGIATTLAVLVLQRRRQLNTIRAVGGSIIQIRRMIFWEAGLIVITGQVIGLLCGFILSTLLIFVVNRQSFGWTFVYRVDWVSLLAGFPLIFLAAMLAALPAVKLAMASSPAGLLRGGMR